MLNLIAVFLGGGLGCVCRYGLGLYIPSTLFPFATLCANVFACFILGGLTGAGSRVNNGILPYTALIGTGFCGGFSTFSTFTKEHFLLAEAGFYWQHVLYVFVSYTTGMLAFYVGYWAIRR